MCQLYFVPAVEERLDPLFWHPACKGAQLGTPQLTVFHGERNAKGESRKIKTAQLACPLDGGGNLADVVG